VGSGQGTCGEFTAFGARGVVTSSQGQVEGRFEDGAPAVVQRQAGRGRVVHFAWMPGISYAKSSRVPGAGMPPRFSETLRRWIVYPTRLAGVQPPVAVDRAMVETPVLLAAGGAAITLLNWSGAAMGRLSLRIRLPMAVRSVESARLGRLSFQRSPSGITCALPLGTADIITLRP
jgi:hypothetical protein